MYDMSERSEVMELGILVWWEDESVLQVVSDPRMRSQTAWHIIRQCVVSSVGFYARITQPHIAREAFLEFDRKVIEAISVSHSLPPGLDKNADRKLLLASLGIASSADIFTHRLPVLSSLLHLNPATTQSRHHHSRSPRSCSQAHCHHLQTGRIIPNPAVLQLCGTPVSPGRCQNSSASALHHLQAQVTCP